MREPCENGHRNRDETTQNLDIAPRTHLRLRDSLTLTAYVAPIPSISDLIYGSCILTAAPIIHRRYKISRAVSKSWLWPETCSQLPPHINRGQHLASNSSQSHLNNVLKKHCLPSSTLHRNMLVIKSATVFLMAIFHISIASAQLRMQYFRFSIPDQRLTFGPSLCYQQWNWHWRYVTTPQHLSCKSSSNSSHV
jgi:hypothetical protein